MQKMGRTHHVGCQVCGEEQDEPVPEWSEDVPTDHGLVHPRVLVGVQAFVLGFGDSHLGIYGKSRARRMKSPFSAVDLGRLVQ